MTDFFITLFPKLNLLTLAKTTMKLIDRCCPCGTVPELREY